jgi:hypothetical protein
MTMPETRGIQAVTSRQRGKDLGGILNSHELLTGYSRNGKVCTHLRHHNSLWTDVYQTDAIDDVRLLPVR